MHHSGLKLDMLEDGKPLLYKQHALANLFGDGSQRIPTEIVFPDETVSVGLPPVSLEPSFSSGANHVDDLLDDFQNRVQTGPLVVYASATPAPEIIKDLSVAVFGAFFIFIFLALAITSIFLGYSWVPFVDGYLLLSFPTVSQKWLYSSLIVSYCLPFLGILYRLPILLSVQSSFSLAILFLELVTAMYSLLDAAVFVLVLLLRSQIVHVKRLLSPQIFCIAPEL